jgi:hypothetical protein
VGWITLSRRHFVCISCRDSAQPLDDRIGLTGSLTETARRLLSLAGGSWSFGRAHRHLQEFCGIKVSDEFIRRVSQSVGIKMAGWMEQSPAAAAAFTRRRVKWNSRPTRPRSTRRRVGRT